MAVEPGFQVRLGIYQIDADVVHLRAEIWRLLRNVPVAVEIERQASIASGH